MTAQPVRPSVALFAIWYAIALHYLWAILLAFGPDPRRTTALHGLTSIFPRPWPIPILVVVASLALYALTRAKTAPRQIALLVPQQLVLGISAASAVYAMVVGHFADGVPRAHIFLIADQAPAVIAFAVHTATILYLATRWRS